MFRTLLNLTAFCALLFSSIAHADIVIESTHYLYKRGARGVIAQIENKDDIPYLTRSWVETPAGKAPSFMTAPPSFRLERKQQNTVHLFATGNVNTPTNRESMYYFNVMAIPPADDARANNNTIWLAVRHRMRLVYRPETLFDLSPNTETKKLEWRKADKKLTIKSPAPFFLYFNSIQIGGKEVKPEISSVAPMTTKEMTLRENINTSSITWKVINDYGEAGSLYSSSL